MTGCLEGDIDGPTVGITLGREEVGDLEGAGMVGDWVPGYGFPDGSVLGETVGSWDVGEVDGP